MTTWGDSDVWVTRHALERLELHYPGVVAHSARGILGKSAELDAGAVLPVLGRRTSKTNNTRYFLPPDRRGLLVVEPETRNIERGMPWVLVTYLRLEASQQHLVDRLWPKEAA